MSPYAYLSDDYARCMLHFPNCGYFENTVSHACRISEKEASRFSEASLLNRKLAGRSSRYISPRPMIKQLDDSTLSRVVY